MQLDFPTPWLKTYKELGITPEVPRFTKPIYSILDEAAQNYPDRIAILFEDTRITYKKLLELSERFAGALANIGVKPGDRVALILPNIPQMMIAFWGVVKAGAIVSMINPVYTESEICYNVQDSGARFMVLLDKVWEKVTKIRDKIAVEQFVTTSLEDAFSLESQEESSSPIANEKCVHTWKAFTRNASPLCVPINDPLHDLALIQYTGGSTGTPKGAKITHANLGSDCFQTLAIIKLTPEITHTLIAILPFFHVYGLIIALIFPTSIAAAVITIPKYAPLDMLKIIEKFRPTIFPGAPAIYASLLQQKSLKDYDLTCIDFCICGSAPLPQDTFERFQSITKARIVEGYGLTEASPITHISPLDDSKRKPGSIGLPLASTIAKIMDIETGTKNMPIGELGELVIKGPQVMQGYWNREEENKEALRGDWLYTGDIARMDEDGFFFIQDRKKDMGIVGGLNVYPREIDEVLASHPDIHECVTVCLPDVVRGETLKAFIVLEPGKTLRRSDAIAWCRERLAPYKVPRAIEIRESLPRTTVGKVLRRVLRDEELAKRKAKEQNSAK